MNRTAQLRDELQQRFPTIAAPRSIFEETDPERARILLHQIATKLGWMITTRIIDGALHVWRMK